MKNYEVMFIVKTTLEEAAVKNVGHKSMSILQSKLCFFERKCYYVSVGSFLFQE